MPEHTGTSAARTVLGFDYGSKRLGVAVGQELGATARPLATLAVRQQKPDWNALGGLVATWHPDQFVVGRPATADGQAHVLTGAIERFARQLEGRFRRPVSFIDERLSSYAAAHDPRGAHRAGLDAASACVILETWFAQQAGN